MNIQSLLNLRSLRVNRGSYGTCVLRVRTWLRREEGILLGLSLLILDVFSDLGGLQSGIHTFGFKGEYAEDTFVDMSEGLMFDEPL